MSKIFKISGNFMEYGEWSTPDPSFTGEIVVDDANVFCGYCTELYNSRKSEIRFLAGAFASNGRNGKIGIAFYKMSNNPIYAPQMYIILDLEDICPGSWKELYFGSYFVFRGGAKIAVEEVTYSEDEESRIKSQFEKIDRSINCNSQLLEQVQCCIDILTNAK